MILDPPTDDTEQLSMVRNATPNTTQRDVMQRAHHCSLHSWEEIDIRRHLFFLLHSQK